MKKLTVLFAVAALSIALLPSCKAINKGDRMPETSSAKIDSISYYLGVWFGNMVKQSDFGELNFTKIQKGVMDVLNDKEIPDQQEVGMALQEYVMKRQEYVSERTKEEGIAFLAKNKRKPGVDTTESGLQYKIIADGDGLCPTDKDTVEVHYRGTLIDGTEFDSSYERNEPASFTLGQVIAGWSEGIKKIKEGGKIELYIPYELGYGSRCAGIIPGYATLIFEVELLSVKPYVEVAK